MREACPSQEPSRFSGPPHNATSVVGQILRNTGSQPRTSSSQRFTPVLPRVLHSALRAPSPIVCNDAPQEILCFRAPFCFGACPPQATCQPENPQYLFGGVSLEVAASAATSLAAVRSVTVPSRASVRTPSHAFRCSPGFGIRQALVFTRFGSLQGSRMTRCPVPNAPLRAPRVLASAARRT